MPSLDPALVSRLDRPGPRYTSYPTANMFSESFGADAYGEALRAAGRTEQPLSVYVHVPFCERLCTYCACNVTVRRRIDLAAPPYVDAVFREADRVLEKLGAPARVARLQLGGGTPNYLPPSEVERLVEGLAARFEIETTASLGIEVDPRHRDEGQLDRLRALGFNRVSFGVQDFDETVQHAIGRDQSLDQTQSAVAAARAAGFDSVNIDLVYGLPFQTGERFARTLDAVADLSPDRLALFSFAYVPQVKPHQKRIGADTIPRGVTKAELFVAAVTRFADEGWVQVGLDHFAKPSDALARSFRDGTLQRSFQGYEVGPPLPTLGLGPSAVSDLGGAFAQTHHREKDYTEALERGTLPVERGWTRSFEDEVRRAVIHDLMCRFEVDFQQLEARFGVSHDRYFSDVLPDLDVLADQGLVTRDAQAVRVTELGRLFVRNVAMSYDAYLPSGDGRFSRTV